ncbi:MAG TPA: prepilin peptidase [Candidatus Saccharimonadales bacterium]
MIISLLAVLGVIFGSFVSALTWRFHEQAVLAPAKGVKPSKSLQKRLRELSMARGRSMCLHCGHELAAKDLVPILSWLALRGKCRYCGEPISWHYPALEVLTGLVFVASYLWWPLGFRGVGLFQFVLWLVFLVGFMALAVTDLRWFTLADRIVYPLIGLAIVQTVIVALVLPSWHYLWMAALAALIIAGVFYVLFQVSGGRWIGGGDVKLAVVLGLLAATPWKAVLVIFAASVIGTIVSIPLLFKGKQGLKAKVPFGPLLLAATFITVLFGTAIVNWYNGLIVR